jgi:hypothetical protein
MRRTFTCGALLVCSTVLAFAVAQEPPKPEVATEKDALDRLLTDFAAATAKLDIDKAEKLFLPPDDTAAGKNRQAHLSELRKDWKRAKESGANAGPSVQFKNTKKIIRTQMLIGGPGGPQERQVSEVEFTVAFTKDGWKIVSMDDVPTK